jgi:predicted metal-dependent hydrolase
MRFYNLGEGTVGRTLVTWNGKKAVEIRISERLRTLQATTIMVVMHEMLHVEKASHEGHGWRFDKRMLRLAKAGAFNGLW